MEKEVNRLLMPLLKTSTFDLDDDKILHKYMCKENERNTFIAVCADATLMQINTHTHTNN